MRVHPWVNPIVFGNDRPNRTTDIGKNVPQNQFFGFHSASMEFFMEKTYNSIWYPIPHKKGSTHFCRPAPTLPQKWSCFPKTSFRSYFGKDFFFFFFLKKLFNEKYLKPHFVQKGYIDFCL